MGCFFTPSFKGSFSLFVTVGLSPYAFRFFAFLLVANLSSTLSDDSCIAVSLSLALAHVSSFPWTSVLLFLRSVPVLSCASSCLHSYWRMALTLDPGLLDALPCIFLWTAFCSILYTLPLFIGLPAWCLPSFHIHFKSSSDSTFSCAKVVQATYGNASST